MTELLIVRHPSSVNHPRLIDADKSDVVAVLAVHARDVRKPSPARTMVCRHPLINTLDVRRIGYYATGIVAGNSRAGSPSKSRSRDRGTAGGQHDNRGNQDHNRTHCSNTFTLVTQQGCKLRALSGQLKALRRQQRCAAEEASRPRRLAPRRGRIVTIAGKSVGAVRCDLDRGTAARHGC